MFYDIVFFLSPEAVAAGAKVSLVAGKYVITKDAATTIQAINGGRPPVDQSAEVIALTAEVSRLQAIIDALPPPPPPPDLTQVAITPGQLDGLKLDAAQLRADLLAI